MLILVKVLGVSKKNSGIFIRIARLVFWLGEVRGIFSKRILKGREEERNLCVWF